MRKGFTLIELLIVIAIIGLLATLAIVSLTTAQQKARDTKRVADMKQLQNATELYFSEATAGQYPVAATWAAYTTLLEPYITQMPQDPSQESGTAPGPDQYYYAYAANDALNEYVLGATLEDTSHDALDGDDDVPYVAALAGWTGIDVAVSTTYNISGSGDLQGISLSNIGISDLAPGAAVEVQCDEAVVPGAYCLSE